MTNAGYEIVTIDPDGGSPLPLGSGGTLQLAALTVPPAQKLPVWAKSGDGDGGVLVRDPHYDLRVCTLQVRVRAASMDLALAAIGTLEGKLQEAEKVEDGMPVLWQPANSTKQLRLRMLMGQITDMPVTVSDGWFIGAPILTVEMTCKPFLYGAEVTGPTASAATPMVTVAVPSVPGDVPAEARLVLTDASTQARRWCEWGLEQRYYNAGTPAALFIDSADLVTSGFAGAGTALTGAFGGSAIAATLIPQPIAVCGTGPQPHIGVFRVKGRVYASSTAEYWRLSWKTGDQDRVTNDWAQPIAHGTSLFTGTFSELDFGLITVPQATAGSQIWSGQIESYTTNTAGETGDLDYLELFPAQEGYGRLEAAFSYRAGVATGFDAFTTLAAGTALNSRVAPIGGTWATSGATTDFVGAASTSVTRTTTGFETGAGRIALLGSATPSDVEAGVTVTHTGSGTSYAAVIARYVDSSNFLMFHWTPSATSRNLELVAVIAGVSITLASQNAVEAATSGQLRLIVYQSGHAIGTALDANGGELLTIEAVDSRLATGGTLATGKSGFADESLLLGAQTRTYTNAYVATPAGEQLIINSGRSLEVRSDSNKRQSADGTTYSPDVASRGSRLFLPAAGDAGRTTRIAVQATREDPITMASRNDGDTLNIAIFYTPRFLAVPR